MRILVTGSDGYIGVLLTPLLEESGHEVVGLDYGLYEGCSLGPEPARRPELRLDIRDVEAEHLAGIDAVIHLAALPNDPLGNLEPETTFDINRHATFRLARIAKAAGVERFVFSSSCSLYGAMGDAPVDESAQGEPVTPYGLSKVQAEEDLAPLADDDFSLTFLRSATAYGASPRLRGDLVVNNLVGHAFVEGEVYIKSDGTPWRPLVHAEDIARAFRAVVEAPREAVHAETFNVGRTEENYRVRELAELVHQAVPGSSVVYAPDAGPDKRNYRVTCDKIARQVPGFEPQWTVPLGIEQLHRQYVDHGLSMEQLTGECFQRHERVKRLQRDGRLDPRMRWLEAGHA